MIKVVSVKFKGGGRPYYFAPCKQPLKKGDGVIVENSTGPEFATVCEAEHEVEESQVVLPLMPVIRLANQKDLEQIKKNEERKTEAMKTVREKIEARGLEMKPVDCEFSFDGTKVVVYFTAENRVDFRELIKDLSSAFHMRIELRQIGIREEIKLMGGLAPCGRECCCVRCLQEPKKVSVKMAKNQGLSLNPGKISGLCGRLMCCLEYENDYYAEVCKKVPKIGGEVTTSDGKGIAVNVNMLNMTVKVKIEQGESVSYKDYDLDKISFMRGNEVIGTVASGKEDFEEDVEEEKTEPVRESAKPQQERKKEKNKEKHNRHGGKQEQNRTDGVVANNGKNRKQGNQNDNRPPVKKGEDGAERPNQGKPNGGNGQNGQKNNGFNRNRKKHCNNKNHNQNGGEAKPSGDKQKNNA